MTQVTVGAKRARVSVPGRLVCSACDSKFFDVCGPRESALRLNQIFLESLAVSCQDDPLSSSLKFCPNCSHKLNELETLMSDLETLQMKIQNMKDFFCATVTNVAFQAKQGIGGESATSNSFLSNIRDQVLQNWISLAKNGDGGGEARSDNAGVNSKAANKTSSPRPDFEFRGQNGLEIFDRLEEQEIEMDQEEYAGSPSSDSPYAAIVEDAEVNSSSTATEIKIDPDSWGIIDSVGSYTNSNSNSTDGCYVEEDGPRSSRTAKGSSQPLSTILNPSNGIETMFYDESESDSSTYVFSATEIIPTTSNGEGTSATASQQGPNKAVTFFPRNNASSSGALLNPVKATLSHVPAILKSPTHGVPKFPKDKNFEIEMCTLCFKYIASGVKHSCGEKSTTTMYQCAYCNAVFHSERVLNEHVRRHIPLYSGERHIISSVKPVHICKLCRKQFPSSSKLALHVKNEHARTDSGPESDIINCQLCPKTFRDVSLFRIHMIAHLKNPNASRLNRNSKGDGKVTLGQNYSKTFGLSNESRRHVVIGTKAAPL